MGYGRSGELIAQLLSENLIPFVAVDSSTNQVAKGKVSAECKPERATKGIASTFNYTALSAVSKVIMTPMLTLTLVHISPIQAQDLPVYFGDAGSPNVLHLLGVSQCYINLLAYITRLDICS